MYTNLDGILPSVLEVRNYLKRKQTTGVVQNEDNIDRENPPRLYGRGI